MKNTLKKITYTVLFVFYFILTNRKRLQYLEGKNKGMHCSKIVTGLTYSDYTYHKNRKPEREYMTYSEFMEVWI